MGDHLHAKIFNFSTKKFSKIILMSLNRELNLLQDALNLNFLWPRKKVMVQKLSET
uniref:Uncharacterized protein n=1 Tax=Meloidogyne enterolobii TaxID=390850 RepID=A0A6V7WSB4_MELEN|nr:unnamed protein product [Meloidogyne enterolobii]